MTYFQRPGGFAAIYLGLAYAVGIALFLVVLDYPSITSAEQKMELLVANAMLFHVMQLVLYVIFGVVLVIFALALHERLKDAAPFAVRLGTVLGVLWAGLLVASGMVTISGIDPALRLYETDPIQAAVYWSGIETVAEGIGLGRGEILGGLMTLLFALAGLRGAVFPKALNYLGVFVGIAGIASTVPGLHDLAGLFGIAQLLWILWLGTVMLAGRDVRHET